MLIDLHVHTNISPCSRISISDLIKTACLQGLDGICITDHDTMLAKELLPKINTYGLTIIVGMEYSTPEGDFLIFGPVEDIPKGLSAIELLNTVSQLEGIAIAAHPFRSWRRVKPEVLSFVEIVEGINGRCTQEENHLTTKWARNYGQKMTGGSDAHTLPEIGRVVTYFDKPIYNEYDLIDQLKYGNYYPLVLGAGFEVYFYHSRRLRR